ncbi:MAG TPA: PDZ domain-containing protein [Opitutaceae bacterium]|nr:PDZ domain-containing protein [Opitutaceae bacterium]
MNSTFGRIVRGAVCASVMFSLTLVARAASAPAVAATPTQDPMLARVFPSIVRIEAIRLRPLDGRLAKQWTGGSGVIISAQGHVITNCHVTEDGDFFRCYLYDGSHLEAKLVGQDAQTDLAVLQLDLSARAKDAAPLAVTKFGDSDQLKAGDEVFALGSPGFVSQSVTRGIVANPSLVLPEQTAGKMILRGEDVGALVRWILHDARIFGGNSGGPLVNNRGEIVGINEIGVFNLSGAIPSNLARVVADNLSQKGTVVRGWSGLTVQPRLESDGPGRGVIVGDVAPDSPGAKAGVQPGDLVVACDGHEIEGAEEKAVAHFNRLEASQLPGREFVVDFLRAGNKQTVRLKLAPREPAQADDTELRSWGAVVRDLTPNLVREERLPDAGGVWLENIQPAGPCGQAEPTLRRTDVLIAVEGKPVSTVKELTALTEQLTAGLAPTAVKPVLASVRRDGAVISSVVELRTSNPRNPPTQALKAWLGAASQPLTPKLATRLGIKADGGARLTRIYAGTKAEAAGLKVGDVILAIDGTPVPARRPEDTDVLARQIRQYKADSSAAFSIWRDGQKMDVNVTLELQPKPTAEMPYYEDVELEFFARDLAFDDRVRLQLPPEAKGALIESATVAGWASLAGLRADDVVEKAGNTAIANLADLKKAREEAAHNGQPWWVLLVQRGGQTQFVEINLKPIKSKP